MVYNTGETDEQLKAKYNPEGSHLRQAQERMLDMLIYFDGVCKQAGVKWRLDGGTFLGAIRHKGFIPWDDDLDVAIDDKKEWNRLVRYLKEHPHPQYVLQDHSTDPGFFYFWMTIRDTNSEYIHEIPQLIEQEKLRKYRGLQIDVFPWSSRINPKLYRFASIVHRNSLKYLAVKYTWFESLVWQFEKHCLHPFFRLVGYSKRNSGFWMHDYGTAWMHRLKREWLFPYKEYEFEGHSFPGPASPEGYLGELYGNYMDLPPENGRRHHKVSIKLR